MTATMTTKNNKDNKDIGQEDVDGDSGGMVVGKCQLQ